MNDRATMHVGPLGSAVHVLHADAQTVEQLAAIDWNRHFRRVCLDPVRGLITLMSPSRLHEDLSEILGEIVGGAADALGRASKGLRSTRLRRCDEPPGTGMEPDCTFYIGERADRFLAALLEGESAADVFLEHTAPDLVIEVELTSADAGKAERYGQMGVRELWRLHGRKGSQEIAADFLALQPEDAPQLLAASQVLEGLTPADVCEAVEGVRFGRTRAERTEAVTRIVRRRGAVRVREEEPPYRANPEAPVTSGEAERTGPAACEEPTSSESS